MYIYFDKNGTIKEVINDESIRRGSNDYNKIYCYLEGNPVIDDIWYLQKNPDGTLTNEVSFVDNIVTKTIPYDSKRDMKYFQDFEEYKFYVFTLSSSYLSQNGLVVATIRVAENNTLWALGELTFNVQANIVNSDNDITQSQYDYLLLTISSYYSKTEIDNKLSLKADKSDTYTKTESDNKFVKLNDGNIINGYNEFYGETKFFNDVYVDNFDITQTRGSFSTDSNVEAGSFSRNGTDLDSIYASKNDTYTKTEVDSALSLKADKSDTYTKQEVNELGAGLYGQIETAQTSISNLNTETYYLRLDLDNLSSVQNVVDVVATYADLQSHDKDYLETNDKIQVMADETHGGASTIYNLEFDRNWKYVGAYGTNSYTKTEVDTKLSTKADKTDTYTKTEVDSKLDLKANSDNVYSIGQVENLLYGKADKSDTYTKSDVYTKTEVDGKLNGYIKDNDTTYSATVRGKEVIVSAGAGYGSTTYGQSSIHTSAPRKPTCDYYFPDEKSGTLALTSDIPTVNNPTITFTQGGTTKGSISLNQASDQTIALDAGGSGGGSSVVANPTLNGDEATLDGLEVDGTKYKVGGGSEVHLYQHRLSFGNGKFLVVFDTFSNTPITQDDLKNTYAKFPTPFSVNDTFSGYLLAPMTFSTSQFGNFFGCIKIMEDGSGASFVSETAPLNQDTVTQIS